MCYTLIFRNPTSVLDGDVTVNWEPMGSDDNYLNINQELKMEKDLMKDSHDYWKKMYKNVVLWMLWRMRIYTQISIIRSIYSI